METLDKNQNIISSSESNSEREVLAVNSTVDGKIEKSNTIFAQVFGDKLYKQHQKHVLLMSKQRFESDKQKFQVVQEAQLQIVREFAERKLFEAKAANAYAKQSLLTAVIVKSAEELSLARNIIFDMMVSDRAKYSEYAEKDKKSFDHANNSLDQAEENAYAVINAIFKNLRGQIFKFFDDLK